MAMAETMRMPVARSRGPRLESIKMVEKTIQENSGKLTKYQLWHRLPKGMQYPILNTILSYLKESDKIQFDGDKIVWIPRPKFMGAPEKPEILHV